MAHASFDGLRVLSLESRRAIEVEKLIRTYGGQPFVVPFMREVKLGSNHAALEFADRLMRDELDVVIFTTGVGVRALLEIVETRYEHAAVLAALGRAKIITRGSKPRGRAARAKTALGRDRRRTNHLARADDRRRPLLRRNPEDAACGVAGIRCLQPELLAELTERTASVLKVPVYQWALPHDLQPLRNACTLSPSPALMSSSSPPPSRSSTSCRSRRR